ncbi:MAG: prolyl oligopeptidase family serine peptidase [Alteromonadales bacterium]|nr:prolyl oligopeptidase family serine peptidase [Alteromonadales bacterium]
MRTLSICFAALIIIACSHNELSASYKKPSILPDSINNSYDYPRYQGAYQIRVIAKTNDYQLNQITFPSQHNILAIEHDIIIDYYQQKEARKTPVIIVLPILGGNNKIASIFARYFAKHGYASVVVHRQKKYKKMQYIKQMESIMRQIVFDHKQALDWVETRPELDNQRIGVFGVSMGGIKAALLSGLDMRIKSSVIALAAGDLANILTYSSEKHIKKRRLQLLEERQITEQQLYLELSQSIKTDPIHYAQYINATNTLMILASFDQVVPFEQGQRLKEKIGNPETIYLFSGHYSAILYLPYVQYQSRRFFDRKL